MTPTPVLPPSPLPAVILAGGRATRMGGGDKGLRLYQGQALLDRVIDRLAPQACALALNANGDASRFAAFGLPVLPDSLPSGVEAQPGPLAGILSAMDWARAAGFSHVLSVPTDSPFLPHDLMARLANALPDATSVAMAASADGTAHPVIALWPSAAAPALRAALAQGQRRVRAFAQAQGMVLVPFPAAEPDPFTNINHSAEVAAP